MIACSLPQEKDSPHPDKAHSTTSVQVPLSPNQLRLSLFLTPPSQANVNQTAVHALLLNTPHPHLLRELDITRLVEALELLRQLNGAKMDHLVRTQLVTWRRPKPVLTLITTVREKPQVVNASLYAFEMQHLDFE